MPALARRDRRARSGELAQARASNSAEAQQIAQLKAEAESHEQELTVLMAHLNEARRPIQSIQADLKRVSDELALKTSSLEQLNEENRNLRATLERTRGALQEREFLIRRLERSESNNANALGRIQTEHRKARRRTGAGRGARIAARIGRRNSCVSMASGRSPTPWGAAPASDEPRSANCTSIPNR